MNLLFITHASLDKRSYGDGSTRYRCFNVAEIAHENGHTAEVVEFNRLRLKDLSRFDLIIWLRPVFTTRALTLLNRAARLQIPCIADVDDLIFDSELAADSPAVSNRFASLKTVEKRYDAHARILQRFNAITVSSVELERHVRRCFKDIPTATVHNGLSDYWIEHADQRAYKQNTTPGIAYLSGTRSHDRDLQSICEPLAQWLDSWPDATLDIVGKIDVPWQRFPAGKVRQHPWKDYYQLPHTISQYAATLSPLTYSQFNQAKSHIKFIESAAVGVPLIASPNDDLTAHDCPGLLFAHTPDQWRDALQQVSQCGYRERVATTLREYVRHQCSARAYTQPLIKAWESGSLLPANQPLKVVATAA